MPLSYTYRLATRVDSNGLTQHCYQIGSPGADPTNPTTFTVITTLDDQVAAAQLTTCYNVGGLTGPTRR